MKIKDDILKWQETVRNLSKQTMQVCQLTQTQNLEINELKKKVDELVNITNEMAEAMLALLRLQVGE